MINVCTKVRIIAGKHAGREGYVVKGFTNTCNQVRYLTVQVRAALEPQVFLDPELNAKYEEITVRENKCLVIDQTQNHVV